MDAKGGVWRAPVVLDFSAGPNGAILTAPNVSLFISDGDYEVASVAESHETLGTDGGGVTVDVVKCTGTQAASAGASVLASTFNLKAAINTVVRKDRSNGGLQTARTRCQITKGDRLALNFSGTLTSVTGVCVTVVLNPIIRKRRW